MSTFLHRLSIHGVFSRGLPDRDDLNTPETKFVESLREVLRAPLRFVLVNEAEDQPDSKNPLRKCLERGWLFSERADKGMVKYRFASQLHELYTEWLLLRREDSIEDPNLLTFVINVIKKFSPHNLRTREDLSTTPQSIPEAQFQQEFYRACCVYTGGCVTTFPECGTPKGRIDFFIRSKKWGVELLRNGSRIHGHHSRFTTGEYGTWLKETKMEDYILIDFCSKKPNQPQSGKRSSQPARQSFIIIADIKSLIYGVSTNEWEHVEVYNHELKEIEQFHLFYGNP
jgi:hypothetical protein